MYDLLFVYRFVVFYGVFFLEHKKTTLKRSKSSVMSDDGSQELRETVS